MMSQILLSLLLLLFLTKEGELRASEPKDYFLVRPKPAVNSSRYGPAPLRIPSTLNQKCVEGKQLKIGYQNYTPYVDSQWNIQEKAENISGIFPHILRMMLESCCPYSKVGSARRMSSTYEISKHFTNNDTDTAVDILFPVYGHEGKASRRFKTFPLIPILTAPKIVVLVEDSAIENVNLRVHFLATTILNAWPMWVFIMVSTFLAGFCMWILDQKRNPKEFPPTFFAGSWDGIWWAFITMTTVGYGDLSPKSVLGRIFSMIWISLGVILISLFTGLVSAALNQTPNTEINLAGTEVGAVRGSIEYQVGVKQNADMRYYNTHLELLDDLKNPTTTLKAAMIDNFALTAMSIELNKLGIRVNKELNVPVTYGIVLAHNSSFVETCFREYVNNHPQEIFESISKKLLPVKNLSTVHVEVSAVGKAFYEQEVFKNIVYIECGLLVLALLVGVTYEILYRRQGMSGKNLWWKLREKGSTSEECHELKPKSEVEVETGGKQKDLPDEIKQLLNEYDDFHNKWVERVKLFYQTADQEKKSGSTQISPC